MKHYLYLLLALLLATSCQHRKSIEEGELFLQNIDSKILNSGKSDSSTNIEQQLIEAEYNYHFTPEQKLRLRMKQLYYFNLNDEVSNEFIAEVEAEALRLGNDSLLALMRRQTFLYCVHKNDTARALRLFHLQEPILTAQNDTKELNIYHTSLALLYARLNQMDKAVCQHLQTRWMNEGRIALWYSQMSQYLLDAGRDDEAILYADSCLNLTQKMFSTAYYAYSVKTRILIGLGRIPEALACYAAMLEAIETSHKKQPARAIANYSDNESILIYQYAELLHQNGRTREAIPLLEKILAHSLKDIQHLRIINEVNALRGHTTDHLYPQRLLAECYRSLGETEKAFRYVHIADSLQRNYTVELQQARFQESRTKNSNQYLTTRIQIKEQEVDNARLTQYILGGIVTLLLLFIGGGFLWWRNRLRHISLLFNELMCRHAEWMQIRMLLTETSERNAFPGKCTPMQQALSTNKTIAEDDCTPDGDAYIPNTTIQIYHRHYLCALRIMKEQRPFTDPAFDLVTLARLVGTNRTQLSTAINHQTHTSFSNWLAEYRVNYLISQLNIYPDATIDQLYTVAGFAARSTFYRQFHQVTKLTPKQYLKEIKNNSDNKMKKYDTPPYTTEPIRYS